MFMVQFTSGEGRPSTHVTESLDEAVRFVERLHNSEGVADARLFQLTEIPLEVKAYYRVELTAPVATSPVQGVTSLDVTPEPAATVGSDSERSA